MDPPAVVFVLAVNGESGMVRVAGDGLRLNGQVPAAHLLNEVLALKKAEYRERA